MDKVTSAISRTTNVGRVGTQTERAAAAGPDPSAPARKSGTVELSALASDALSASAPIDRGRIDAIRSAIANGEYPVDPLAIASRMVELDLGE